MFNGEVHKCEAHISDKRNSGEDDLENSMKLLEVASSLLRISLKRRK